MTDLLIMVMNRSLLTQRLIAALLLATGLALVIVIVSIAMATLARQADEILEARQSLARFEQLIAMDDKSSGATTAVPSQEFLAGDSEPAIQANLQNRLNSIAGSAGAAVLSAGGVPALEKNGVKYIGLRANLQGSLAAIHNTLLQLETGKPYVTIRELTVRSTNAMAGARLNGPIELSVQLTFFGALDPVDKMARELH